MPRAPRKLSRRPSRQQARTEETRKRLLAAAGRIFARHGFEAAKLEEISASAGYTRGALYAHFEDKEDIFFSLLEFWVKERIAEVSALLQQYPVPKERLRALRNFYAQHAKDRRIVLLSVEFKLFALRHPEAHARLRARQQGMRKSAGDLICELSKGLGLSPAAPPEETATALGAASNALLLERLVDSKSISEESSQKLLRRIFDAIVSGEIDPED